MTLEKQGNRMKKSPFTNLMAITAMRATMVALMIPALAIIATPPAQAQFSDGYKFLKAVKEREGDEATQMISEPGSVIINTRDVTTGQTALHIVIERRDSQWLGFLLAKGANPNLADKKGITPLMLATQLNFIEAVDWLNRYKADINASNRSGETALILAVQLRNPEMVRELMKAGANPDKRDSVAGLSAREYAARDGRANAILAIIENHGKTDETDDQPALNFSGIGPEE